MCARGYCPRTCGVASVDVHLRLPVCTQTVRGSSVACARRAFQCVRCRTRGLRIARGHASVVRGISKHFCRWGKVRAGGGRGAWRRGGVRRIGGRAGGSCVRWCLVIRRRTLTNAPSDLLHNEASGPGTGSSVAEAAGAKGRSDKLARMSGVPRNAGSAHCTSASEMELPSTIRDPCIMRIPSIGGRELRSVIFRSFPQFF